jgi:hypothetical protein
MSLHHKTPLLSLLNTKAMAGLDKSNIILKLIMIKGEKKFFLNLKIGKDREIITLSFLERPIFNYSLRVRNDNSFL